VGGQSSLLDSGPETEPRIAVVVVNWNGWRNTLACLDALRGTQGAAWRLIIIDNASTDESIARLSNLGEDVVLIPAGRNGGWTGGNNLGVRYALRSGFDYVMLLNNDAFVETDTLARLLAAAQAETPARQIFGAQMLTPQGEPVEYAAADIDPQSGMPRWAPLSELGPVIDGLAPVATVHGGAMFARREVFETVGAFDDAFFLYLDESDWCRRATGMGYGFAIVEQAHVRHIEAASTGGRESPLYRYFMLRNTLLFARRHLTRAQRRRVLREIYWDLRDATRRVDARPWPWAFLTSAHPSLRARRRAMLDYLTGRLGDCPPIIRDLTRQWREGGAP